MKIRTKILSDDDINITTVSTPHGYHDYLHNDTGETYRIAIDNEPKEEDTEWESIALDPFVYPEEQVSMSYE